MEKIYRIGSFNLHNIGMGAFTNERDLQKIAEIILKEGMDVVAFQEILSEGKIFTKDDLPSRTIKKNILFYLGGPDRWGFAWAGTGDESNRHEGYAFAWNKNRLDLATAEIKRNGYNTFKRVYNPRVIKVNHDDMIRQPYFARFTAEGKPGGAAFEIRLICVHTYFGKDTALDRIRRQNELQTLLEDIYPQMSERNFQNGFENGISRYTFLLGDYNAELLCADNMNGYRNLNQYRKDHNIRIPMLMKTDPEGKVRSGRYDVSIKTVQYELTTLKKKVIEGTDREEFDGRGYASSYDHFSYDEEAVGHVIHKRAKRIDAVADYCNDDYEKYFKTVSDHIPIMIELKIN